MKLTVIQFGILIFITTVFNSCGNDNTQQQGEKKSTSFSALDLDNRLTDTDSLVVVFYKAPYGEDSLRYTRYYSQISVTDVEGIELLQGQLAEEFTLQERRNNCRGEGKIWCYAKGKIFQTLYFSTRCDNNCCYIYIIKDGNFYYSPILPSLTTWLLSIKPLATEPANEAASVTK